MRKVIGIGLFVCGVVLLARLAQSDFEFPLDADFRRWGMTEFRNFFTSLTPLSKPLAYAYFDGQLIVNGLAGVLLEGLASIIPPLRSWFPTDDAYSVGAALLVSILSFAGACVIFYAALLRAGVAVVVAAVAAIALLLSPQMLSQPLLRQDYLITLPMMTVFYCSVIIAREEEQTRHALLLGIALGLLATIKINGAMFGLFAALAVAVRWRSALAMPMVRFVGISVVAFVAIYLVLMARFIYYFTASEWLALYPTGVGVLRGWSELLPWDFSFYYNIDLLRGHGREFIWLYVICTVATALVAFLERDRMAAFFVLSLIAFSLLSAFSMKYDRGGYHLLPLFMTVIAYTANRLWRVESRPALHAAGLILFVAIALTMGSSIVKSWDHYQSRVDLMHEWSASLGDLWRPANRWLKANVKPGEKICIEIHSDWTLPLSGLESQVTYGPFAYPYPDGAALARQEPPTDAALSAQCDFFAINNRHRQFFSQRRTQVNKENADLWATFFGALPTRFSAKRFETTQSRGLINWIVVYRIKGGH